MFRDPIKVTEYDLAACAEVSALKSRKNTVIVPWAVSTLEKYNDCAATKAALAKKVREFNKKAGTPAPK